MNYIRFAVQLCLVLYVLASCSDHQRDNGGSTSADLGYPQVVIRSYDQAEAWMLSEGQQQEKCRGQLSEVDKNSPGLRELLVCALGREEADQILQFPDENVPDIQDPLAARRLQEFYSSPRFRRCEALTSLLRAEDDKRVRITSRAIIREVANQHRQACFRSGSELPRSVFSRLAVVGKFSGNNLEQIVCMGVLLPDGRVATAKHCFFSRKEVEDFRSARDPSDRTEFLTVNFNQVISDFRLLLPGVSSNALPFRVDDVQPATGGLNYHPNDPRSDLIILRVSGISIPNYGVINLPKQFAPMIVAGFYPGSDLTSLRESVGTSDLPEELARQIVIDNTPGCFIVEIRNDCILHTCQTFGGFSGTPMFQNDGKKYPVSGLHLGSLGKSSNLCGYQRSATVPNRGARLPEQIIK